MDECTLGNSVPHDCGPGRPVRSPVSILLSANDVRLAASVSESTTSVTGPLCADVSSTAADGDLVHAVAPTKHLFLRSVNARAAGEAGGGVAFAPP